MKTFRIVVGVDGSPGSRRALEWAVAEAAVHGGTVQAVAAFDWPVTEAALITAPHAAEERQRLTDQLEAAVRRVGEDFPQVPVAAEVVSGRPGLVLVEASKSADLLAVGSRGHGRLYSAALGSVAEDCIRGARCPVVVIPVPHPGPPVGRPPAGSGTD